jgi:hypothetical protein
MVRMTLVVVLATLAATDAEARLAAPEVVRRLGLQSTSELRLHWRRLKELGKLPLSSREEFGWDYSIKSSSSLIAIGLYGRIAAGLQRTAFGVLSEPGAQ